MFEFRKNDRDFLVGDELVLREWNPTTEKFTGRAVVREVTYIVRGPAFGVPEGYCVMSLRGGAVAEAEWAKHKPEFTEAEVREAMLSMVHGHSTPSTVKLAAVDFILQRIRDARGGGK